MGEKLDRFINLLEGIFELDKADLDFGIYRIINIRRSQIEEFLTNGLPTRVQAIKVLTWAPPTTHQPNAEMNSAWPPQLRCAPRFARR